MKYADCQIGMRVVTNDGRTGRIVRLHPVLSVIDRVPNTPDKPRMSGDVFFNYVSVEYDPPYEKVGGATVHGGTMDPSEFDLLRPS